MPTGAVTLLEASRHDDSVLAQGIVETIVQESPILEQLPMMTLDGEAYISREEKELPAVQFRKVGGTYDKSFGTETKHPWGVTILGGEIFIDNFILRTRPSDRTKARQFIKKAKAAAMTFDQYAVAGDGSGDSFKGFNQLVTEGFGQALVNATNGATIALATLDEAKDLCRLHDPDAWLINRTMRRQITNLGRNVAGHALIDVGTDKFGRQVNQYDGVPLRILGDKPAGTPLLPFTETTGTSSVTASAYLVAYEEETGLWGLMGAGGSMDVQDFGETQAAPGHLGRLEFYPGLACASKYALVRVSGITAS